MNGYVERGGCQRNPSCVTYLSNMADYAVGTDLLRTLWSLTIIFIGILN